MVSKGDILGDDDSISKFYDKVMPEAEPPEESERDLSDDTDELDQVHDIFMLTVDQGQSDMIDAQGKDPEQILAWTSEKPEEVDQLFLAVNND